MPPCICLYICICICICICCVTHEEDNFQIRPGFTHASFKPTGRVWRGNCVHPPGKAAGKQVNSFLPDISGSDTNGVHMGKQQENRRIHSSYLRRMNLSDNSFIFKASKPPDIFMFAAFTRNASASTAYRFFACLSFLEHDQTFVES